MLHTLKVTTCPKCRRSYADGVRFCPADGTLIAQVVDPLLGRTLMGQFKLVALAGRGAMGTVYRAEQANVARTVAVKVLGNDLLREALSVKRFLREAQAAARLTHPNIVAIYLVSETEEGVPFMVMEYVEGQTLGALLEKLGVVETRRALRIARQIASALGEAHEQGIVHRDLKADNILLAERPRGRSAGGDVVKVLDFGIAKLLGGEPDPGGAIGQLTRDGTIFGTPHYIAPEQANGRDVDGRADLYSLGVILFRMVTGRLPFEGTSGMQVLMRHVREQPPRPRELRQDIAEPVEALILRAMEKRPEDRFADADRFIEAIDEVDKLLGQEAGRTLLGLSPPGALPIATAPSPPASSMAVTARGSAPGLPHADDPAASRGEGALDSWAGRPITDDTQSTYEDDLYAAPHPRRALWLGLGAAAVLLVAVVGVAIVRHQRSVPAVTLVAGPAPAPSAAPPVEVPLVEEHVASAGGMAMRAGFESAPAGGATSAMHVHLVDDKGRAVTAAAVEASVRRAGERDEAVTLTSDGDGYRGTINFRAPGRHAVHIAATPPSAGAAGAPGSRRVVLDFEVEATGAGRGPVARTYSSAPSRRGRHSSVPGSAAPVADGVEGDEEEPERLIPASSSDPIVPRALGPAPDAVPAAHTVGARGAGARGGGGGAAGAGAGKKGAAK